MGGSPRPIIAIAAVAALTLPSVAAAQTPTYRLGLGDLMTAFVQPRHTKLGLAGSEGNWPYAAYELHELQGAFGKIAEMVPKYRNYSIPDLSAASVKEPLIALDHAIKAKDLEQFASLYRQLTAACNACHQSTDHAMIVIRVPTVSAFPDQDFRPPRP